MNPDLPKRIQKYRIDFGVSEVYECGAALVSLLAVPRDDELDSVRSDFCGSLCALVLRARYEGNPNEIIPQYVKPIYAFRELARIEKDLRILKRRLRDRMIAGRMAIAFLQEVEAGKPIPPPKGLKKLSINEMARLVLDDAGQSEPGNVESRIWRPSLPVIHLAAATAVVMEMAEKHGVKASLWELVLTREVIEAVVREAERYEVMLQKSSRLNIGSETLVQLRVQN